MRSIALLGLLAWAACGCGGSGPAQTPDPVRVPDTPPDESGAPVVQSGPALVVVAGDEAAPDGDTPFVRVVIAATHRARQRGLGGKRSLENGHGMLFVYPESRERNFWMKDCHIPLDIAFLDEFGEVLTLATLPPGAGLFGDDVPDVDCDGPVRYVLETPAGWLEAQGVAVGDTVDVRDAVRNVVAE